MTGGRRRRLGGPVSAEPSGAPPTGGEGPRRGRSTWEGPLAAETAGPEDNPELAAHGPRRGRSTWQPPGGARANEDRADARSAASSAEAAVAVTKLPGFSESFGDPEGSGTLGDSSASGASEDPATGESDGSDPEAVRPANPWRSPRTILLAVVAGALAIVLVIMLVLILRPKSSDPVAISVPVALTEANAPKGLKLGVVVSIGQGAVEGAEWASAAEGAAVAKYRLLEGGSDIALLVENDHGTASGAKTAVNSLRDRGVSGIVFATSGEHLSAGIAAAAEAKLPAILTYAEIPDSSASPQLWSLAPSEQALEAAYRGVTKNSSRPLLIDAGPGVPSGLTFSETLRPRGADLDAVASAAAARTGSDPSAHTAYPGTDLGADGQDGTAKKPAEGAKQPADAIVISGNARSLAQIVQQLQAKNVSAPLILSPAAGSPGFARALAESGGSVTASLEMVGVNIGDAAALGNGTQARAASAFLQEVRQLAADPDAKNLSGDGPFSQVAPWADVRSHDAVLSLALAAGRAQSTQPAAIGRELAKLQLTAGDGIAGTILDFRQPVAASGRVQLLHATGQSLGLRPSGDSALTWFPAPDSGH